MGVETPASVRRPESDRVRLQERLLRIAGHVPPGSLAADIGTDHALLPIYLVKKGICQRVVATDLNAGPLAAARSTVALVSMGKRVELRLGDGMTIFQPGEADVFIIAGMGGVKIADILNGAPAVLGQASRLILQPLGGAAQLRRWLLDNNWGLIDEDLVIDDGRYYEIIVAEHHTGLDRHAMIPGLREKDDRDLWLEIGPRLIEKRHPLLVSYLEKQIQDMENILVALRRAQTPSARQRKLEWAERIADYKEIIRKIEPARSDE